MSPNSQYDVVVVGAGLVGASLACALGDCALRVAVLELAPPNLSWPDDTVDLRVSAISRASEQIFRNLDVWPAITVSGRLGPYSEMHVWDSQGNGAIHFDCADVGADVLGHVIENRIVRRALLNRMAQFANVELRCPAEVADLRQVADGVVLYLEDGEQIHTRLVVGADGGRSRIRQLAQLEVNGWPYDQKAVVATVTPEQHHEHTAWQRFLATGPLAFLPLFDERCSIVWSTTPEHAEQLLAMDDGTFCDVLATAFEHKLGDITACGPRAAFPLSMQFAPRYVKERVALIGDAAHTIHPLAGQGVNLGFLDAAALAEVLLEGIAKEKDPGSLALLRRYERWRKSDNMLTMAAMDGFKRTFSNDDKALAWLRNRGLSFIDRLQPVKSAFMRRAMGLEGELPTLARPPISGRARAG